MIGIFGYGFMLLSVLATMGTSVFLAIQLSIVRSEASRASEPQPGDWIGDASACPIGGEWRLG